MMRFFPMGHNEIEKLYKKACSKKDAMDMSQEEFLKVFSCKLGVSEDKLCQSQFLENAVLQNVIVECKSIPKDTDINGQAGWQARTSLDSLDAALMIKYPLLTLKQREEMVNAYNKKYGPITMTAEKFYERGFCLDVQNSILFPKDKFCELILPDLAKQTKQEERPALKVG